MFLLLLCVFAFSYNATSSSLSCQSGLVLFKGYSCVSDLPYNVNESGITYLVKKDQTIFQMKVKKMTEEEIKSYEKIKEEKKIDLNNSKNILVDVIAKNNNEKNKKIEVDNSNNEEFISNNLEQKIKIEKENFLKSNTENVLSHYAIIKVPITLNLKIN